MEIKETSIAGSLESSDVMVTISASSNLEIEINSAVQAQFEDDIMKTIKDVLTDLNITKASVKIQDKGALDCVLRARLITAIIRSTKDETLWEKIK